MTQLDPQAQSLLEAMKASGQPPVFTLPVPDARRARRRQLVVDPPRVQIAKVEDDLVPGPLGGIPVRWYRDAAQRPGHEIVLDFRDLDAGRVDHELASPGPPGIRDRQG